jgi:putative transposase
VGDLGFFIFRRVPKFSRVFPRFPAYSHELSSRSHELSSWLLHLARGLNSPFLIKDKSFSYVYKVVVIRIPFLYILAQNETMARKSLRKPGWDYSCTANYFITINLAFNSPKFGAVSKEGLRLNDLGELVKMKWESFPDNSPNIKLGEYIIMPNHIHGIIYFNEIESENRTTEGLFEAQRKNLPSAMRGFKSGFTSLVRPAYPSFEWQTGYHDRILFTQFELARTVKYIRNNSVKAVKRE